MNKDFSVKLKTSNSTLVEARLSPNELAQQQKISTEGTIRASIKAQPGSLSG